MGNTSSHTHEPLERGFTRGKFGDVKNGVGFANIQQWFLSLFLYYYYVIILYMRRTLVSLLKEKCLNKTI